MIGLIPPFFSSVVRVAPKKKGRIERDVLPSRTKVAKAPKAERRVNELLLVVLAYSNDVVVSGHSDPQLIHIGKT